MDERKGRKVVCDLHAHMVFVTKKRGKVFTAETLSYLENVFRHVCKCFEAELREFNGEKDHVHLLIEYPPKVKLSELVNSLKGVSSRKLKQQFSYIEKDWSVKSSQNALWSPSYFIGSVGGAPLDVLKRYIENQQKP